MKVKIKKLHKDAVIPFKTYKNDFCYDVVAVSCEEIAPNVYRYGTGLAFEIVRDDDTNEDTSVSIEFRCRSSVWKTGMVLSNCVGTIDEPYHSEVMAVFYHIMPNMPRYKVGDKIGQITLSFSKGIKFEERNELTFTGRGGYGSTGLEYNKKKDNGN